jgi:hypothetical protein
LTHELETMALMKVFLLTTVTVVCIITLQYFSLRTLNTECDSLREHIGIQSVPLSKNKLNIPANVSNVFINLGSNLDPILPPQRYASTSLAIAVEPIVAFQIPKHPLLIVIPAAVSTTSG